MFLLVSLSAREGNKRTRGETQKIGRQRREREKKLRKRRIEGERESKKELREGGLK